MAWSDFTTHDDGPLLAGRRAGSGPRVLLLHGGPGLGFDCSGLVQYVYARLGVPLPHYTFSLYRRGRAVSRSSLRPGDLVFFSGLNHVGIYAGGGKYIHAPRAGTTVRWASLASHPSYYGARRIA